MMDQSPKPDRDAVLLDYAPRRGRPPRVNAVAILAKLFAGVVAGGGLMYLIALMGAGMSGDRGIAMMLGLPVMLGLALMCARGFRFFGVGLALTPAMALLALFAICGH